MNNYDEIAKEAVKNITECDLITTMNKHLYLCAYEAAKLQAERFNKDLDESYIEYLMLQEQRKDGEGLV